MTVLDKKVKHDENMSVTLSFYKLGIITVSLPSLSLIVCVISAVLFQYDQVTETVCNVTNSVPSVSAVTGVSPQRYLWRVSMALQAAPRFAIGLMYLRFYEGCQENVYKEARGLYNILKWSCLIFYNIENFCLILVSYISNLENYPIHEKLFVVFMISCILYQLATVFLFAICFPQMATLPHVHKSYKKKVKCMIALLISSACLLFCFILHRFFCIPGAFTFFSIAEYFIVLSVTCFHFTAVLDFKDCYWSASFCKPHSDKKLNNCHDASYQKIE